MGSKKAPAAPDYTQAAERQAQSSRENTNSQTWANRPTVNTPWGQQTWDTRAVTDPATGQQVTEWTQNVTLSPDQQQALDSQIAIQNTRSQGAQTLADQAVSSFQRPMDWQDMPQRAETVQARQSSADPRVWNTHGPQPGQLANTAARQQMQMQLSQSPNQWRQTAQSAVWNLQRPMLDEQQAALEAQLANQGLSRDSEAWGREMRRMDDARARAQLQAVAAGRDEAAQLYGQDLSSAQFANTAQGQDFSQSMANAQLFNQAGQQRFAQDLTQQQFQNAAQQQQYDNTLRLDQQQLGNQIAAGTFNNQNRQQAIAEEQLRRGQTLNELNALLTGQQVGMPSMPSFNTAGRADSTNYMSAAQNQYQGALDAYNARQAGQAGITSGLFSLGSAAMGAGGWGGLFSMGSDPSYKVDVTRIGTHEKLGIGIYSWTYLPEYAQKWGYGRIVGVMADELAEVLPEAVSKDADGHTVVDYSRVWQ